MKPIGILALQGDVEAHGKALEEAGFSWIPVKYPGQTGEISGLVLPGGETTTMIMGLMDVGLWDELIQYGKEGNPILATCAGVILLADLVTNPDQMSLGLLDIDVSRNAYGRQIDSFVDHVPCPTFKTDALETVYIRAPRITRTGPNVDVLATRDGEPVLVQQGNIVGATFHPELSPDSPIHSWWGRLVLQGKNPTKKASKAAS